MYRNSLIISGRALLAALALVMAPGLQAQETDRAEAGSHLLAAEIAYQADNYLEAAQEYRKAAELSSSVEIAQRATRVAWELGFYDEALRSAERWMELDPDSVNVLRVVAQLQLRAGKLRDARRSYERVIESGTGPAEQRLAALLPDLSAEDPERADKLMRQLAKPYKDSAEVSYASAVLALQAGDADYARKCVERAIELADDWLKPKLLFGRIMLLDGDEAGAIDYTARLIGDDPYADPDARMELALMYIAAGRDDDALSQVNQILLEQSANTEALRLMAIINFRQGNFDAAWDDFEDLLASREYTTDALYYLARIADMRGDSEQAIRLYSEVRSGQNAVASQRRASALIAFQDKDPEYALQRLEEFAEQNPNHAVDMVLARAQLLSSLERFDEALGFYDKVVKFRPDDEGTALGRAELLLRMGRLEEAVAEYRKAVKRWPESALALNALGYTLADRTENYREAEKLIRKALKIDPDSPAIIDSLGWVLYKQGDYEAALEQLRIAYDSFPDPEVASHLVDVLVELGRREEAIELLVAAEERNPDNELLEDVRKRRFTEND